MSSASTESFLRRLLDEHDEGLHDEPETVNRFCASCAQEYFGPNAEPDDPDHDTPTRVYRWLGHGDD